MSSSATPATYYQLAGGRPWPGAPRGSLQAQLARLIRDQGSVMGFLKLLRFLGEHGQEYDDPLWLFERFLEMEGALSLAEEAGGELELAGAEGRLSSVGGA